MFGSLHEPTLPTNNHRDEPSVEVSSGWNHVRQPGYNRRKASSFLTPKEQNLAWQIGAEDRSRLVRSTRDTTSYH